MVKLVFLGCSSADDLHLVKISGQHITWLKSYKSLEKRKLDNSVFLSAIVPYTLHVAHKEKMTSEWSQTPQKLKRSSRFKLN